LIKGVVKNQINTTESMQREVKTVLDELKGLKTLIIMNHSGEAGINGIMNLK
jgi:hypothetical protein